MADSTVPISFEERQTDKKRYAYFTVASGETIPQGTYVSLDSSGEAQVGGDDANTLFAGLAVHDAVAGETLQVVYGHEILATTAAAGAAAANIGADMNLVDNQTLNDDAGTTNDVKCGVLVQPVTSTTGWVRLQFAGVAG